MICSLPPAEIFSECHLFHPFVLLRKVKKSTFFSLPKFSRRLSKNICADGTPNGYSVYEISGNTIANQYYKSTNKEAGYQIRAYSATQVFGKSGSPATWHGVPEKSTLVPLSSRVFICR